MSPIIASQYDVIQELGRGNYAVVHFAKRRSDGMPVAIKVLEKRGLNDKGVEQVQEEMTVLKQLDHPNLLKLVESCEDDERFFIVTELCDGGELFDRIVEREYYSEQDAQKILRDLASALLYMHSRKIVHRDLKPENILLSSKADDAIIKVADFGFSKQLEDAAASTLGTPAYVAPEILEKKPYDCAVDMWSFGVIAYVLLCGYLPFADDNPNELFRKIRTGAFVYDSPYWDNISQDAKDLISSCLQVDPRRRLTASDVLKHPWINSELTAKDITPAISELRGLVLRRKPRRSYLAVFTAQMLKSVANKLLISSKDDTLKDSAA